VISYRTAGSTVAASSVTRAHVKNVWLLWNSSATAKSKGRFRAVRRKQGSFAKAHVRRSLLVDSINAGSVVIPDNAKIVRIRSILISSVLVEEMLS
jgi:hypothetical protein